MGDLHFADGVCFIGAVSQLQLYACTRILFSYFSVCAAGIFFDETEQLLFPFLKLNSTDLRHLYVAAVYYIFIFRKYNQIYLTHLKIFDDRYADEICPDENLKLNETEK